MRCSPCSVSVRVGLALIGLSVAAPAPAQDIEPRRWTPLPVGLNVISAGLSYDQGNIAFDPALQIEDATIEVKSAVVSYLHAFDLFGKSARVHVVLPYLDARWEGMLNGLAASTERSGFGDPRVRLSVNFLGAPALSGKEYQAWRASQRVSTVAGVALAVRLPLGEYKRESNRLLPPLKKGGWGGFLELKWPSNVQIPPNPPLGKGGTKRLRSAALVSAALSVRGSLGDQEITMKSQWVVNP